MANEEDQRYTIENGIWGCYFRDNNPNDPHDMPLEEVEKLLNAALSSKGCGEAYATQGVPESDGETLRPSELLKNWTGNAEIPNAKDRDNSNNEYAPDGPLMRLAKEFEAPTAAPDALGLDNGKA